MVKTSDEDVKGEIYTHMHTSHACKRRETSSESKSKWRVESDRFGNSSERVIWDFAGVRSGLDTNGPQWLELELKAAAAAGYRLQENLASQCRVQREREARR